MPLTVVRQDGTDLLALTCDACDQRIEQVALADYRWVTPAPMASSDTSDQSLATVSFTHKQCGPVFEAGHPLPEGQAWATADLD